MNLSPRITGRREVPRRSLDLRCPRLCSTGGGGVYTNDDKHWDFVGDVMKHTISANPIHVFEF